MMTRRILPVIASVLLLASAVPAWAAEAIGVVGSLQGSATAANQAGARNLNVGDKVFLDEEVTTNAGSKLQLMLNDRSTITLNANSKVKVNEFAYNPSQDSGSMAMEGVKGAFRFIGGALSKQQPVTIKTPVSSIGIRGGIVDTHIGPQGQTNAIFLFGDAMTMTNQNGQTSQITTPGQGLGMQTPTDIPGVLSGNVVQQLLGAFEPVVGPQSSNNTGGGDPAQTQGGGEAEYGAFADSDTPDTSGNSTLESGVQGSTGGGSANRLAGDINNSASVNNTTKARKASERISAASSGGATGSSSSSSGAGPTYSYTGRYGVPVAPHERGSVGANVITGGADFQFVAEENYPSNAIVNTGIMPKPPTDGKTSISNISIDDGTGPTLFDGFVYGFTGITSYYYHLDDGSSPANIFLGKPVYWNDLSIAFAATSAQTMGEGTKLSYYKFLPDLNTYTGIGDVGFFDYGLIDMTTGVYSDDGRSAPFALAVDWDRKKFITGHIDWSGGEFTFNRLVMAFGDVEDATGAFEGFNFLQTQDGFSSAIGMEQGIINSGANPFFSDDGSVINSLVMEGTQENGAGITAPGIRIDGSGLDVNETRTSQTITGYAAGHLTANEGGAIEVMRVSSGSNANNVSITSNASAGTVTAGMILHDVVEPSNGATIDFNGTSAALSDDMYAVQQTNVTYNGDNPGSHAAPNGFLASANAISNVTNRCGSCEFVHWGVWAGEVEREISGVPVTDVAYSVPYVAGQMTQDIASNSSLALLGTVFYSGMMYGTEYNGTSLQRVEGEFDSYINLSTRTLESFTANVGSLSFATSAAAPINGTGGAMFNDVAVAVTGGGTGTINGALFGPMAENVGGSYNVQGVGFTNGAGVFLGNR